MVIKYQFPAPEAHYNCLDFDWHDKITILTNFSQKYTKNELNDPPDSRYGNPKTD